MVARITGWLRGSRGGYEDHGVVTRITGWLRGSRGGYEDHGVVVLVALGRGREPFTSPFPFSFTLPLGGSSAKRGEGAFGFQFRINLRAGRIATLRA